MKNFNEVHQKLKNNVGYYSALIAKKSSIDKDDAAQMLNIRMWQASKKYKHREGTTGRRYYLICVKTETDRLLRDERNAKQRFRRNVISINSKILVGDEEIEIAETISDANDRIETIHINLLLDNLRDRLTGRASEIVTIMRSNGGDLGGTAKTLRTSKQNVTNIIRRRIKPMTERVLL